MMYIFMYQLERVLEIERMSNLDLQKRVATLRNQLGEFPQQTQQH